jgi:hypothetical protein
VRISEHSDVGRSDRSMWKICLLSSRHGIELIVILISISFTPDKLDMIFSRTIFGAFGYRYWILSCHNQSCRRLSFDSDVS